MADDAVPWVLAWSAAAHGEHGFYGTARGRSEEHFATSVTRGDAVATEIIARSIATARAVAGRNGELTVTDVGAGDGTLLRQLLRRWPSDLAAVTRWRGIDVRARPGDLPPRVEWLRGDVSELLGLLPPSAGLVIAHELLDDIPCPVLQLDDAGRARLLLVEPHSGREVDGPCVEDASRIARWCERWWPPRGPASRIEVGLARDEVWRAVCGLLTEGLAIGVDYGHVLADRARGRFDGGTLTGYLDGRIVRPVPDGTRNLTAHVALDSCAEASGLPFTDLWRPRADEDFWWLVQSTAPIGARMHP